MTPTERDLSLRRLRRVTTSVALVGAAAVVGLGYVAAATVPATASPAAASSAPAVATGAAPAAAAATDPTAAGSQYQAPLQPPAQPVTSGGASTGAHATSGGS